MFPTAHSTVYRNEAGEPLGWSDESGYDPREDYDPGDDNPEVGPEPDPPNCCKLGLWSATSAEEDENGWAPTYECEVCGTVVDPHPSERQ